MSAAECQQSTHGAHSHHGVCGCIAVQGGAAAVLRKGAGVVQLFRTPGITTSAAATLIEKAAAAGVGGIHSIQAELVRSCRADHRPADKLQSPASKALLHSHGYDELRLIVAGSTLVCT